MELEHVKRFHSLPIAMPQGETVYVEGPVEPEVLKSRQMHPDLDAFRRPEDQHAALIELGAIEVADEYRGLALAKRTIRKSVPIRRTV